MADNGAAQAVTSAGQVFAWDDIGGVAFPRSKIVIGADGVNGGDVSASNPMPVTAATLPLPTGAATDATLAGVLTIADFDTKAGSLTETAPATDTASSGLNGRLQRIAQRLSSLIALLPGALGAGGGLKVDGSGTALPVSAASLPLPTGASTEATLGGVLTISDFDTKAGSLTETAPATDTASSGLNGRLQRIAQRLSSLIALLPGALGAGGGLKVDGSGTALPVSLASVPSHAVTNTGTFAVQAADAGDVASGSADSGNPVKQGFKATTALSGVTLVSDAQRVDARAGVDGVQITRPHCNLEDVVQERTTNTDGASTAFASGLGAPGAGVRLWVKKVTIANSSAAFCTVDLRDGSAGSVLWTLPVPASGGISETFDPPLKLTANTALAFDASAATTTLSISANGFKSKV